MAAELHNALTYLSPTTWEDVPQDRLAQYAGDCFAAGELICNSVPPQADGTPFSATARPHFSTANTATCAAEVRASDVRASPPSDAHKALQKHWGRAMKFSPKENPLGTALFKMAGHDRHGAWFARRTVVEGLGFAKFHATMRREFPASLLVQGGAGAGATRGLAADRRLEGADVPAAAAAARLDVYQMSAQMPSPVSPREFIALLLTTDDALSDKSAVALDDGGGGGGGGGGRRRHQPRHFMVVSRPCEHPDAPPRAAFVRGQYESVELIREIPLHACRAGERPSDDDNDADPELNPVEWIMITRSDPGGGIPRFMVDRGTPGAMLTDVTKFLDWACALKEEEMDDLDVGEGEGQRQSSERDVAANGDATAEKEERNPAQQREEASSAQSPAKDRETGGREEEEEGAHARAGEAGGSGGIVSNLATTLEAGISAYAPAPVSNYVHQHLLPEGAVNGRELDDDDDGSDSSSTDSFFSSSELRRLSTAPEAHPGSQDSGASLGVPSGVSSTTSLPSNAASDKKDGGGASSHHDRELRRIAQKRDKLTAEHARKREAELLRFRASQARKDGADNNNSNNNGNGDGDANANANANANDKARERLDHATQKLDARHSREMDKLDSRHARHARKLAEKAGKRADRARLELVARERDDLRARLDRASLDADLLVHQVEALQRENTALAGRLGRLPGGAEALAQVREEVGGKNGG